MIFADVMDVEPRHRRKSKQKTWQLEVFRPLSWRKQHKDQWAWHPWTGRYATLHDAQEAVRGLNRSCAYIGWKFRVRVTQ